MLFSDKALLSTLIYKGNSDAAFTTRSQKNKKSIRSELPDRLFEVYSLLLFPPLNHLQELENDVGNGILFGHMNILAYMHNIAFKQLD